MYTIVFALKIKYYKMFLLFFSQRRLCDHVFGISNVEEIEAAKKGFVKCTQNTTEHT